MEPISRLTPIPSRMTPIQSRATPTSSKRIPVPSRVTPVSTVSRRTTTPSGSVRKYASYHSPTSETTYRQSQVNECFEGEDVGVESGDFDDLIFALQSGNHYSTPINDILNPENNNENEPLDINQADEQYAIRRIRIGDTHL